MTIIHNAGSTNEYKEASNDISLHNQESLTTDYEEKQYIKYLESFETDMKNSKKAISQKNWLEKYICFLYRIS